METMLVLLATEMQTGDAAQALLKR